MNLLNVTRCLWLAWLVYWYAAAIGVKRAKSTETIGQRLLHVFPLGLAMWLMLRDRNYPILMKGQWVNAGLRWIGAVLTAAGLLFSIWARLHLGRNWSGMITLKHDHQLIRTGPYRFIRHPIYTGLLLAAVGTAMVMQTFDAALGVSFMLVAFVPKLRREEALLSGEFGEEYRAYRKETAALLPFVY